MTQGPVVILDEYGTPLARTVDVARPPANLEPGQKATLSTLFASEKAKSVIVPLLPKGVTYEEVYAETAHVVANNPKLLECTPMSLVFAVARAVQTGLVIGEKVHIVPYKTRGVLRATKVTDYKGEIELILSCGGAKNINALCVYANEVGQQHGGRFEYLEGTTPEIIHRRIYDPAERGAMVGAYAVAWTAQGIPPKVVFMHIKEIDAIRAKSQAWSDLTLCPPWYAKKTVVHQIAKELPMTTKLRKVLRSIDIEESEDDEAVAA